MRLEAVVWTWMFAAMLGAPSRPATAHTGHAEAPSAASTAVGSAEVQVTADARANLGLEVVEAELRPLATTLAVIGEIAAAPDRAGAVATRIAGRVVWVAVADGDAVQRGQQVIEIESLLLGDPPPRARYASPIDGVVIDRHVVPGDSVAPNAHLLEVADLREVVAVGRIFEGQIGSVAIGQRVRVSVPSYPGNAFDGAVERLGGALDVATRSLPVYVRVQNRKAQLRPGMRASLAIVTSESDAALTVPRSAVLGDFGAAFVFREKIDDSTRFERVPIATGASDDRFVEVVEGLLPGDRVATRGNYSLQFLPPVAAPHQEGGEKHVESSEIEASGYSRPLAVALAVMTVIAGGSLAALFVRARRERS